MTNRPGLPTAVGRADRGENQFRGFSVGAQLAGDAQHWSALSLAVGHRALSDRDCELLGDVVVCSLAADPHIWPLKVTRLVSSFGNAVPALAAGMLCTSGGFMGWGTYAPAARFLQALAKTRPAHRASYVDGEVDRLRHIPGFGVAFRDRDERATALAGCVHKRGFEGGEHWQALVLANEILERRGAPMNIAAATAAIFLDVGFSPSQLGALGPVLLLPNYLANAVEGSEQAPELLQRLPSGAIEDRTPSLRLSPRARAATGTNGS
ncbi:MAG: hypothetical protein KUG77_03705 [Nannocystaceae bacterium]|nr:hypothetical protein [Nannocystaceae bacterium]